MQDVDLENRGRGVVMLVDDSQVVLVAGKSALEKTGFSVVTVSNPMLLPVLVRKHKPDLVLLDIVMPAIRGDKVLEIARQYEYLRETMVVLHSTRPAAELEEIVTNLGAAGFLPKITADAAGFVRGVERWIELAKRRESRP